MDRTRAFVLSLVATAGLAVFAGCESPTVPAGPGASGAAPSVKLSAATSTSGVQLAYVANAGSSTVSVIDVASQTVTATVGVGDIPVGVAATPDGSLAYVVNTGSNSVSVIDVATQTVTATVGVGASPQGVAVTPDGSLAYVTNVASNNVSVIDVATQAVTETVGVGTNPVGVAVTPDGSLAYVTNESSNSVSVIDVATQAVTATVGVGTSPSGVAVALVSADAGDLLQDLKTTIDDFSLDSRTENSLLTKVRSAEKSLDKGNTAATCSQLADLLDQITNFQSAGKLTAEEASELTKDVTRIRAVLGC
jgi:YVTN family beta-propeller protein